MESEEEEKYCTNCKRSVAANNFAIHSAYCERNIFVCKICNEPVGISEKDEHFDNYHVISPCNLCEASIEKWMKPDHMKICPKRLIVCEYCEAEISFNEYTEHVEFCGSRTEKCLLCKKYIMMKDKAKHTELHRCEEKYERKKIEEEIKQNKVNEVISCMESSTVKKTNSEDSLRREETRKGDPKTRIGANFEGMKNSAFNKTSCDSKRMEQDLRMQSVQGATALPDRTKEKSSRYGECHICKQSIPWIDMNIHIPSCASLAGKCSLCGEDVPNHAMKDHMRGHISGNFQSIRAPQNVSSDKCPYCAEDVPIHAMKDHMKVHLFDENRTESARVPESPVSYMRKNSSDHDQNNATKLSPHFNDKHADGIKSSSVNEYQCPLCLKMVPRKEKHRHEGDCRIVQDNTELDSTYFSRSVSQDFFECPFCSEKVSEENRQTHLSLYCKILLERNGPHVTLSMRSDSSDIYECPLCMAFMPLKDKKRHELFECEVLIANSGVQIPEPESYANATKKTCQCSCRKKSNSCGKCKNIPQHKMSDYQKSCHQRRVACHHCKEMFDFSAIDGHEKHCPAKSYKYCSKYGAKNSHNTKTSDDQQKGAVPKKKSFSEMLRPETSQCKYCCTTLNMDILKYHEDECVHQPVDCPECSKSILIKDLKCHDCKNKKKKNMTHREDQHVPEEKNVSPFRSLVNYMFKTSSNKEKDEKESNRQDSWSYNSYSYSDYQQVSDAEGSQPLYFQDALVPCEFCNTKVLASQLVLHETGCQPDLVCYAKQEPSGNPTLDQSNATCDSVISNSKEMKESVIRFNKTNIKGMEQPFFPENSFLTSNRLKQERKSDTKAGEFLQLNYEKNSEGTGSKSEGKNKECSSLQSVWNSESYGTEDYSDQMSKHLEDPMDVDQFNECTINARTMKHDREFIRQTSEEMISEDSDMNAFLCFLNDDRINKLGKEYEIETEVNEKRADFKSPEFASYSAFDLNLLREHTLQKNYKDCSDEKNTNIEGGSIAYSLNSEVEFGAGMQQLKDLQLDSSAAITYKQTPIETSTLEKKDEEPEISTKQKILLDAGVKSNKGLIDDFKKYLPDLKFASPKEKFFSADGENDELCAKDDERCEKLFEKQINKVSIYDRLSGKEECADSLKNQTDFKFGMYHSSASCYEKNICETKEDENMIKQSHKNISTHANYSEDSGDYITDFKNYIPGFKFTTREKSDIVQEYNGLLSESNDGKYGETQGNNITDVSKHIGAVKDNRKLASNSYNLRDHESAHFKSESCSLKNTEHEAFLQRNVNDEPLMPSMEQTARNTASENECISHYKKYFPDFRFAASEKSTISKEDTIHHSVSSKRNLIGASEKLYEQQLHKASKLSDCSENERESANSFNPLADFKYASCKSTPFNDETYQRKLDVKKDEELGKQHLDKTSTYIDNMSKNEIEYSNDFKKYLPDFKFGSQITKMSKDKTSFANLSDKKDQFEKSAFKPQSAQLSSNESVNVQKDSMKKIKDLETLSNIKKQAQQAVDPENRAKWNQWRETVNSSSSDSE